MTTNINWNELLAGWKNKSDVNVYRKPQMTAPTTWLGYITNPSPESITKCWAKPNHSLRNGSTTNLNFYYNFVAA